MLNSEVLAYVAPSGWIRNLAMAETLIRKDTTNVHTMSTAV